MTAKQIIFYNKNNDLIEKLINLKENKSKSKKLSKNSLKFSKKLLWKKISLKYLKLLKV